MGVIPWLVRYKEDDCRVDGCVTKCVNTLVMYHGIGGGFLC